MEPASPATPDADRSTGSSETPPNRPAPARAFAVLGCAGLVFLLLLVAAFSWDCVRMMESLRDDAHAAGTELENQEARVISALLGGGVRSDQVLRIIENYRAAGNPQERERIFDGLIAETGRVGTPGADPSDPIRRRAADEIAGALNRRQIALRHSQEFVAEYNQAARGIRGRIAIAITGLPEQI